MYWLSGYIFFGSSESVFERIRHDIESIAPKRAAYVILDFASVPGVDSSAVASLVKLRNFCDRNGAALVYSAAAKPIRAALKANGFFAPGSRHQMFEDLNLALAWCEDRLIAEAKVDSATGVAGFGSWLQHQLGADVSAIDLIVYLERKDANRATIFYRQGDPADTVDLVAEAPSRSRSRRAAAKAYA